MQLCNASDDNSKLISHALSDQKSCFVEATTKQYKWAP